MPIFLTSLKENGHLDQLYMTVFNVGSRKLSDSDDYAAQGWSIFAPNLSIYGFDADADACDAANSELLAQQINWREQHIPLALNNRRGNSTLYITQAVMCSSLYQPNETYLAKFPELAEPMKLDYKIDIETTTLDYFCESEEISTVDFLQTDVQGADLNVLEGAEQLLNNNVLAIQAEVLFSDFYLNSPLFADVDAYLRKKEFTLFHLDIAHRARGDSPLVASTHPGQVIWGNAFYFRDLTRDDLNTQLKTPDNLLKLACLADMMDFTDFAIEILEYLTLNYGQDPRYNVADAIVRGLSQFPNLVNKGLGLIPVVQNLKDYITISGIL